MPAPLTAQTPVNPQASPEARALLTIANWTDRAYDLTGKYPADFGQDFGFQGGADKDSTLARPALVEEAMRQYCNGASFRALVRTGRRYRRLPEAIVGGTRPHPVASLS